MFHLYIYYFLFNCYIFSDSDSQHPHLERDDEQRQPQKKSRRKALLLDNDTQEQLIEWVRGERTFVEEGGHRLQGYKEEDGALDQEGKRAGH